jgi:DNA-binding NarL/FixJ family response regulator
VLLTLAALAAQLALLARGGGYHALDVRGGLIGAASTLPLIVWRRSPLATFVVATLASTTLNLLEYPPGPPVGATTALFLLAATSTGASRRAIALVAVLLAAHVASAEIREHAFPTALIPFGLLVWTLTLVAGDRVRLHRERIERARRLAVAEERSRIARALHDSVGHAINVILVQAGAARLLQDRNPAAAQSALRTIEDVARQAVGEIDQLVRTFEDDDYIFGALRAGAAGFLLKRTCPEELIAAIHTVAGVGRGLSNAEIAAELVGRGVDVKTHVKRILMKLGLRDRVQAVILAYESGLVGTRG